MQKHRLLPGELLPPVNNDVGILWIILHAESVSAILLRRHNRGAGASEQIKHILTRLTGALHLVIKQLNRLHGRMLRRLDRLIEIQYSCLSAVFEEVVLLAFRPSVKARLVRVLFNFALTVQARFMFPLEILSPHYEGILHPNQALPDAQHRIFTRTTEVITFAVGVPNVKWSAWFHDHRRIGESIRQELPKGCIFHVIVLDFTGGALIVHIVRRIGEKKIDLCPPPQASVRLSKTCCLRT